MHRDVWKEFGKWVVTQVSLFNCEFHKQLDVPKAIIDQIAVRVDEIVPTWDSRLWIFKEVWGDICPEERADQVGD